MRGGQKSRGRTTRSRTRIAAIFGDVNDGVGDGLRLKIAGVLGRIEVGHGAAGREQ